MFPWFSENGTLAELDPADFESEQFYDSLIDAFTTSDGQLQAVPKDMSTLALYFNTAILMKLVYRSMKYQTLLKRMSNGYHRFKKNQ